jgi:prophage antirepressor-like protein
MLGYADPDNAITLIHKRNKERMDKFSTGVKMTQVEGTRTVTREITAYSFKGLLEICRYSNQPKADAVMDFLWEMADEIRKTGSYSVKSTSDEKRFELAARRLTIQEKNANARLAKILQRMIESPQYPITDDSKRILLHEVAKLATQEEQPTMLPDAAEKLYSNAALGTEIGLSNRRVMKLGRSLEIVAPEGQGNEWGVWKMTKSPNGPHECAQWFWKENGRAKLIEKHKDNTAA